MEHSELENTLLTHLFVYGSKGCRCGFQCDVRGWATHVANIVRCCKDVLETTVEIKNNLRVKIDLLARTVQVNADVCFLSRMEFELFRYLLDNAGKVVTREQILHDVWFDDAASNVIDVYIHYLRKKLSHDIVKSVNGVGYTLNLPAAQITPIKPPARRYELEEVTAP
jgi:DNA-binding winged helix-turn-helix (wHTH) protein